MRAPAQSAGVGLYTEWKDALACRTGPKYNDASAMPLDYDEMGKEEALRLVDALFAADVERVKLDAHKILPSAGGGPVEEPAVRFRVSIPPPPKDEMSGHWLGWEADELERVLSVAKELNYRTGLDARGFRFWRPL